MRDVNTAGTNARPMHRVRDGFRQIMHVAVAAGALRELLLKDHNHPQTGGECLWGMIRPALLLRHHSIDTQHAVRSGDGQLLAVRVQVEIAGILRQFDSEKCLRFFRLPKPDRAAVASTRADDESGWVKCDT